jgi:hypothetical protein
MPTGPNGSWQNRYEAAKARDEQRSAAWVQSHFGGPVIRTVVKELPLLLLVGLIGLFTLGWQAAFINMALLLIAVLLFRAWARRRYVTGTQSPSEP